MDYDIDKIKIKFCSHYILIFLIFMRMFVVYILYISQNSFFYRFLFCAFLYIFIGPISFQCTMDGSVPSSPVLCVG